MKSEAKDKNFNYKLFGESELENMKNFRRGSDMRVNDLLDDIPSPENTMEESVSEMLNNLQERVRRLRPTKPLEIGDDLP